LTLPYVHPIPICSFGQHQIGYYFQKNKTLAAVNYIGSSSSRSQTPWPHRAVGKEAENSLAPDEYATAFDVEGSTVDSRSGPISTSKVVWTGERLPITANEALAASEEYGDSSPSEEAEAFLLDVLAGGAMSAAAIKADASGAGVSWRTIESVKKRLGIKSRRSGNGWALQFYEAEAAQRRLAGNAKGGKSREKTPSTSTPKKSMASSFEDIACRWIELALILIRWPKDGFRIRATNVMTPRKVDANDEL